VKLTYRPEIDGLRTVAVGAVILYHAQITILGYQPFQGGFIGVDIFFVISGYLITSIILKELVTTGTFSFKRFYERRIRRILPALLFVMLVSLPFAWMYLLPSSFIDFSKSILYSLGFSSNFYFHYSGQEYSGEIGLLKPFLHTWSLSVEEQFYILFPIVLLITFKYFRDYLIHILILGFIVSLGLADWGSKNHSSFNFYVLPTRGWELLAGSILAYFEITNGNKSKNKKFNLILPFTGFILIGHSILFFDDKMLHPSFYTLSPIIGVCLIIWFTNKNEIVTKILSTKLFVGIGLISYSLYLWHYPIFAFFRLIDFDNHIFIKIMVAIITIILSIISFYLIEKPFRNKKNNYKTIVYNIVFLSLIILLLNFFNLYKNGFPKRFDNLISFNNFDNRNLSQISHEYSRKVNIKKFDQDNKIKILILGDSHSKDLFIMFKLNENLYKNYDFIRHGSGRENFLDFDKNNFDILLNQLVKTKVYDQSDIILISHHFKNNTGLENLEKLIKKLNKKIILTSLNVIYKGSGEIYRNIPNTTILDRFLLDQLKNNSSKNKIALEDIRKLNNVYHLNRDSEKMTSINNRLKKISEKYNLVYLNKEDFQCELKKNICFAATNDGYKTHYDYGHYTLEGAKFFGKRAFEINWFKID
jgi:peptidoglycan/LPS O-acetylase OafA/YrhL